MVSRKQNSDRPHAAYGDWTIRTDRGGNIIECFGYFNKNNARNHANGTISFLDQRFTWIDEKQHQAHHPHPRISYVPEAESWVVEVPLIHAKAFKEWLEENNISFREEKTLRQPAGREWRSTTPKAKHHDTPGQNPLFPNGDGTSHKR